jgi:hypothetical protein
MRPRTETVERPGGAAARLLLRAYPKQWRARYGDELLETLEAQRLGLQGVIDMLAGAVDARLSRHWRRSGDQAEAPTSGDGRRQIMRLKSVCGSQAVRYTRKDALIGAGTMLVLTAALMFASIVARGRGLDVTADLLRMLAFPGSVMASMPFTSLKGQPARVQAVMIGGTLAVLVLISLSASYLSRVL